MMFWKSVRVPFLMIVFSGTVWILGTQILVNHPKQSKTNAPFPERVSLKGWNFLESKSPTDSPDKIYQYKQGETYLTIEMEYLDGLRSNEVPFRKYDPSVVSPVPNKQLPPVMRRQESTGYYSLSIQENKAYLRSCINPRGEAAITYSQFIRNRYTADLESSRLIPWLIGQKPLRDYRCIWVHLSIPLRNSSPDAAYQVLEKTWPTWYQWWHANFPPSSQG